MSIEDVPALRAELADAPVNPKPPESVQAEAPARDPAPRIADVPPEAQPAPAPKTPHQSAAATETAGQDDDQDTARIAASPVDDDAAKAPVQHSEAAPISTVQATVDDQEQGAIGLTVSPATAEGQRPLSRDDRPSTLVPESGLSDRQVEGVVIRRPDSTVAEVAAEPEAPAEDVAETPVEDLPPLQRYAREFENPDSKPLMAIVLIDTGLDDPARGALADLPFPVTVAFDPVWPDVGAAAKAYRAAGQEVVMLATAIPAGATASDVEVTFGAHASALPEAVAVLDLETGGFQNNRPIATLVAPVLKAQGRGVITWDSGLNAGDQVAQREGVAAGLVFRRIDPAGSKREDVRRTLDRAVFRAGQEGRVIVVGDTSAETISTLLEWTIEGNAAQVVLAPVSAALIAAE